MGAALSQSFPSKTKFTVDDIPDLSGKVMIVTGANTGVGYETAKALLAHNAKVYIAARNQEKAEKAINNLKIDTGNEGIFLKLDLSDLKSVKASAEEFLSKEDKLHVLFNNAGVMAPPLSELTTQGYDHQFGTNVLGPYFFTKLLLPALSAAAKSSPDGKARVVNTSSLASTRVQGINFNTLKDSPARRKQSTHTLYAQSKLANIVVSNEFAKRYSDQGIVSTALNPGNLKSELMRHMSWFARAVGSLVLYPVPMGALTQLYAGTTSAGAELNGKYLIPWARIGEANPVAGDEKLGEDLWKWLEEQVENV